MTSGSLESVLFNNVSSVGGSNKKEGISVWAPAEHQDHLGGTGGKHTMADQTQSDSPLGSTRAISPSSASGSSSTGKRKRQTTMTEEKRKNRNHREQERNNQIAERFDELRELLSQSGIVIPKGTKSAVLGVSIDYIRALQEQQRQAEASNQQMVQQVQAMLQGQHGEQAARAIQHNGDLNNVWDQPSFSDGISVVTAEPKEASWKNMEVDQEYKALFDNAPVPMAIAALDGSLLDCNTKFLSLSDYTFETLKTKTVFNLIARADLQNSFERISAMLDTCLKVPDEYSMDAKKEDTLVVAGAFAQRPDLSLQVSPVRSKDSVVRNFCVTLRQSSVTQPLQAPSQPMDYSPLPVVAPDSDSTVITCDESSREDIPSPAGCDNTVFQVMG